VVTRQEIVPPLETGFLAAPAHPAQGTLFPQPWVRQGEGWARMDRVIGGGWRLLLAPSAAPAPGGWRLGTDFVERDGIAAAWFARHGAAAAILRPDHYVWGVAADSEALAALRAALARLVPGALPGA
jgi:3-(3-hydroxy-phenyl)propionate hydroxylase